MHHFVMCIIHTICLGLWVFIYNSFFLLLQGRMSVLQCTCMCVVSRSRIETPERQHPHLLMCLIAHTDTHTHTYACMPWHRSILLCWHTCTHAHVCVCMCVCVCTCVCVCLTSCFVFLLFQIFSKSNIQVAFKFMEH